jgi:hypothetical protein
MFPLSFFMIFSCPHVTPESRVIATRQVSSSAPFCDSISIARGYIVQLIITSPHAVLAVQNHGNFFLCFQLSGDGSWYLTNSEISGFFSFGASDHTIVEIVALQDMDFLISCCFLDECREILSGNSLSYQSNESTQTCFMATDIIAEVSVVGNVVHGSFAICKFSESQTYDSASQIPKDFSQSFQIVKILSTQKDNLKLSFTGSDPAFKFGKVTKEIGAGIVSVDRFSHFQKLVGEPPYPQIETEFYAYILLVGIPVVIVFTCMLFVWVLSRTVRDLSHQRQSGGDGPPLFDQQVVRESESVEEQEMGGESSSEMSIAKKDQMNPYGSDEPVCL